MKKMLLATALALLITGCAQQTFESFSKQTGSSSTKENHHHHFFGASGIGQKKTVDATCRKFVAAQKMLLKQKPSKHS